MAQIDITILLDYLYNRFATTFLMCLIGAFTKECYHNIKDVKKCNKINLGRLFFSTFFTTVLLCALADYVESITFSIYVLICIFVGLWGDSIVQMFLDEKKIKALFKNLIDVLSATNKFAKAVSKTVDDIDKEAENNKDDIIDGNVEKGNKRDGEEKTNNCDGAE